MGGFSAQLSPACVECDGSGLLGRNRTLRLRRLNSSSVVAAKCQPHRRGQNPEESTHDLCRFNHEGADGYSRIVLDGVQQHTETHGAKIHEKYAKMSEALAQNASVGGAMMMASWENADSSLGWVQHSVHCECVVSVSWRAGRWQG